MAERTRHRLFGLDFASYLSLPLHPADGPASAKLVGGRVASRGAILSQAAAPLAFARRRDVAAIVLKWPTARFRVDRERVVVDARNDRDAVALLIPAVWSMVLAAHRYESLHGCAVERDGRAIAVLGASCAGKSTAALALLDGGWHVVTDDLLALDAEARAVPGPPFVRLCRDRAVGRVGEPDLGGTLRVTAPACPNPVPLAAVVVLDGKHARCAPLRGAAAAAALLDQVYAPMITHAGQARRRFELALGLVDDVPVYGAPPRSLTADRLEQIVGEAAA